jgi:hypothetical protein
MKFLKTTALAVTTVAVCNIAGAQKIKLQEGDLSALKGQTTINIEFTYDNMRVGKFDKEADYIADRTATYNKKEAGKGDSWAKSWVNDREARFEPKFIELFEKYGSLTNKKASKYTLIFHTKGTEPGYNIGISSKPSDIDGEIFIVETDNRSNVIAKISVDNAKGRNFFGYDFDTGLRIAEAYEAAGKYVAKWIKDKVD